MRTPLVVIGFVGLVSLLSCAGKRPANLGSDTAELSCPASPNCVSSDARDPGHRVEPFALSVPAQEAWPAIREEVARIPRTEVASDAPGYLHAECRSAIFRFVDDLELVLRESDGIVAVRSASRLGYSDMGVNRRRVEGLREALRERGVVADSVADAEGVVEGVVDE